MVRLTADVILASQGSINCVLQRELDLRGRKIPAIENLGATQDGFDCIDFTDNEIGKLENFPLLKRLHSILISNNHITKIAPNLGEVLPNLHTLVIANNRIVNLTDLDPLADISSLRSLCVTDNVVSKKPNYRLYVIHKMPDLRLLDFRKIRPKERVESEKLFGPPQRKGKTAPGAKTFQPGEPANGANGTHTKSDAMHAAEKQELAVKAAIEGAKTMEQVQRLERALRTGDGTPNVDGDAPMSDAQ